MYFQGIIVGAASFLVIGFFHPIVIKVEYHIGKRAWPAFLLVGIAALVASAFVPTFTLSGILAVFGFASLWSIRELFEQEQRVQKGWFPRNPRRN